MSSERAVMGSVSLAVPLDRTDHVLGPEADHVVVVEYGYFECPS